MFINFWSWKGDLHTKNHSVKIKIFKINETDR